MSGKPGAYGSTGGGDTDFRKTYDREEYERKAKERDQREREEAKERYQAKLEGKKWHRRASTPPDARELQARTDRLDFSKKIGTTQLVASTGRRGQAGFICDVCGGLAFSNSHEYVEHLNSKSHLIAAGYNQEGVQRATLEDVRARLRWLSRKRKEERQQETLDLDTRLEMNKEALDKEREEKRRKRNEARRSKKKQDGGMMQWNVPDDGVIR